MLAARDQENLTYAHQNAAASKPLNKGLAPKTPSNNTFNTMLKGRLNGNPGGKGDENATIAPKTSKATKNAFVTPLAPRDRAPLGAKTTNAKTKPFQTPAPLTVRPTPQKTALRSNASARRPKLKIHQPIEPTPSVLPDTATEDAAEAEEETSDVPSIEYCGPKIAELEDISSDEAEFYAQDFAALAGTRMFRGVNVLWEGDIGEDGMTAAQREKLEKLDREGQAQIDAMDRRCAERVENWKPWDEMSEEEREAEVRELSEVSKEGKLSSKDAARALSTPRFAAPTAAARARVSNTKGADAGAPARKNAHLPSGPLPAGRGNASTAASRSTIGYAKGRKVSSSLRDERKASGAAKATETVKADDNSKPAQGRWQNESAREKELDRLLLENLLEQQRKELESRDSDGMFNRSATEDNDLKDPFKDLFDEEYVLRWDD